jgi:hypothetical protein
VTKTIVEIVSEAADEAPKRPRFYDPGDHPYAEMLRQHTRELHEAHLESQKPPTAPAAE